MIYLICAVVYVCSIFGAYRFIQRAHSKGGLYEYDHTGIVDIILIFLPGINTTFSIMPTQKIKRKYDKFFKIS